MKKLFFSILLSAVAMLGASSVFAAENKMYFADKTACESALADSSAIYYTPSLKRPAPQAWKRKALGKSECVQMETVQGFQFVALPTGFRMAQNPNGAWHAELCTNWTNWSPTGQSEPMASVIPGVVQAVSGDVVFKGLECDAKCQQVKVCGKEGLVPMDKMNEKGEWLCRAPDVNILIQQGVNVRGEVAYGWKGWQDSGMQIPEANPHISVAKPAPTVTVQSCNTQGCLATPTATFVKEVKSDFCGIRTTDGRVFKLGKGEGGYLVVADWTSGSEGRKMIIRGQQATTDCDVDQKAVETTHWKGMTNFFSLPNGCAVAAFVKK